VSAAKDKNPRLGRYIVKTYAEESVRAFVPPPLPPNPPVRLDPLQRLLEQANQSLGRLDGLASVLPNLPLFIYAYVRKEAVLSSQIEGTQSSLSDLLLFENDEAPGRTAERRPGSLELRRGAEPWPHATSREFAVPTGMSSPQRREGWR
jgi:hypothetical protein